MKTKKELGITKGDWTFKKWEGQQWPEKRWSVGPNNLAVCICPKYDFKTEESEANAKLIADAGTTANKCNLLPSELLERYNEAIEVLNKINCELDLFSDDPLRILIEQTISKAKP